jgi:hypothetical protein
VTPADVRMSPSSTNRRKGVYVDVGRLSDAIAERLRDEVLNAYPKPPEGSYIVKAIVEHGTRADAAAPPGSLAAFFLLAQQLEEAMSPTPLVIRTRTPKPF